MLKTTYMHDQQLGKGRKRLRKLSHKKGPKAIASYIGKSTKAALVKRGFAQADILSNWLTIVGPTLHMVSSPERLTYGRNKNSEATLKVRISPGHAPEFQHFEPLIIERINSFFGYKAVSRISLIQAPVRREPKRQKTAEQEPSRAQKHWLEENLSDVQDDELKVRLRALGTRLLARQNRRKNSETPQKP